MNGTGFFVFWLGKLSVTKISHLLFIPESLLKGKYSNVFKAEGHFCLKNFAPSHDAIERPT
ncbi:hypothetical protein DBR43_05975 [Pedobacter sp. KBW06]|nr:hypothetical protein DBR43_05975 [Pedobacter sp. KBW06]